MTIEHHTLNSPLILKSPRIIIIDGVMLAHGTDVYLNTYGVDWTDADVECIGDAYIVNSKNGSCLIRGKKVWTSDKPISRETINKEIL